MAVEVRLAVLAVGPAGLGLGATAAPPGSAGSWHWPAMRAWPARSPGGWPVTFPAVRPPLPAGWPGRFGLLEDRAAYDEDLAGRVRAVLPPAEAVTERQMFGGLAFMLGGHMFCGVVQDTLTARARRGRPCPEPAACAADGLHRRRVRGRHQTASRSEAATWSSTRPAACWSAGAWPATPPCLPAPPRSSSPSPPPPPAPACAWSTAASPRPGIHPRHWLAAFPRPTGPGRGRPGPRPRSLASDRRPQQLTRTMPAWDTPVRHELASQQD
jgi:hypothetical protein